MHKIIAANWKMHKTRAEAAQTAKDLVAALAQKNIKNREVLVFPPFTAIADVAAVFGGKEGLAVGGQNCYPAEEGAYTGEISPKMLRDAGASWVLTGHSERRHILGESDDFVASKTAFARLMGSRSSSASAKRWKSALQAVCAKCLLVSSVQPSAGLLKIGCQGVLPLRMSRFGPSVPARWPGLRKCWKPTPKPACCSQNMPVRPGTVCLFYMAAASRRIMPECLSDLTMWMVFW